MDGKSELEAVVAEIAVCQRCPLYSGRRNTVPGEGPSHARVVFVGEAPGREEDRTGRPFIGRGGKLLTEALERAGLCREEVFITSVLKCRPPDNRKPRKVEITACLPHLQRQLDVISPVVVVPLGNTALEALCGVTGITRLRGKEFTHGGRTYIPTYHPAAVLRNRNLMNDFVQDLKVIKARAGI